MEILAAKAVLVSHSEVLFLLWSFIGHVTCYETWVHISIFILLSLPFSQFFLVKNQNNPTVKVLFSWKNAIFTFLFCYRDFLLKYLSVHPLCIDFTQISFPIWNVLCLLPLPYVYVVASFASENHWERDVLQYLFSPLGLWYKKIV